MILGIIVIIIVLLICVYMFVETIRQVIKLNKERDIEIDETIYLLKVLEENEIQEDYKNALRYAIRELEKL